MTPKVSAESVPMPKRTKRINNSKHTRTVMARLAQKHGWICWYCGQDVSGVSNIRPHLEHVIPLCLGGTNHESNFALACECCDRAKKEMPLQEFLAWLHRPKTSVFSVAKP